MNLFQKINFISHSGKSLDWKLECDALTDKDWECIAYLISKKFRFCVVKGIPEGGKKLQRALMKYREPGINTWLIVDDVLTTGQSMIEEKYSAENILDEQIELRNIQGVVLFARGKCPNWITPLFQMEDF